MKSQFNHEKLHVLNDLATDQIEDIFHSFKIRFRFDGKRIISRCPIHGGDRVDAFHLYKNGYATRGNWECKSRNCQKVFVPTILGFVRGMLSHNNGWESRLDNTKIVPFNTALNWLCSFLKQDYSKIKVDKEAIEKSRFIAQTSVFSPRKSTLLNINRSQVRSRLEIPSPYYLNRGYSAEILDRFDVGTCLNDQKEMFNRVVVPIYDETGMWLVGSTGRSIYEKCDICHRYHSGLCPSTDIEINKCSKWKHSSDFKAEDHLYNLWNAKPHIEKTQVVVLVESPGNVWRLEEAGIKNSVAMFGTSLTARQKYLLDCSGALSIIFIPDNDPAGQESVEYIRNQCSRSYRLYFPTVSAEDVGAMSVDSVTEEIKPFIERICDAGL